jgi:hypothetical protein
MATGFAAQVKARGGRLGSAEREAEREKRRAE